MRHLPRVVALSVLPSLLLSVAVAFAADDTVKLKGATQAQWQETLNKYQKTHRIVAWNITVVNNEPRYDLEMSKGNVPQYSIRTGRNDADFIKLQREHHTDGFQLKKELKYTVNGATLHAGYWEKPAEGAGGGSLKVPGPNVKPR